nr:PREDICTED: dynein heavy chain 7, axonemal-like [Bemisia tabaci]
MERCSELKIIHQNNPDFIRVLEHAIQYGKPVLLENVDCKLDSALDSVLLKQTFRTGGTVSIKLADNIIEYNQNFRLYITTKMSNPRLGQEIGIKVTVLNFTVNSEAVKDVMQNVVISSDRPDLDLEKTQSMNQSLQNKKLLRLLEDKILETLSTSAGNILEDEASVNILNSSKVSANEAQEKQKIIEITLKSVETSCSEYLKIADNARILFLCSSKYKYIYR